MAAKILDGKSTAATITDGVAEEASRLSEKVGRKPGLAVVLVGEDPASQVYVRNKTRSSQKAGIHSSLHELPATTPQEELLALIDRFNEDPDVNAILVQLPLPKGIDSEAVLERVSPEKDVDGFNPVNVGRLVTNTAWLTPCTPTGIIQLLDRYEIGIEGKRAVLIGRSNIVGKPMAFLLLHRHATITICHSRTRDIPAIARQADILVVAMGKPHFVTADMVQPGAAVIDVGINRVNGKLVGDVHFEEVSQVCEWITPVPGGVGPLTVAMLLRNTLTAFKHQHGLPL